jgi:hypothetical protein
MRLGIDFDNTIVCYDALFHRVALEDGVIPSDLPANKSDVRNHLRSIGREDVWTEMQGRVYGARMAEADPYPGVLAFFQNCRAAGIPVFIVSHKTRRPFAGEPYDLHAAALGWLTNQGFFDAERIGLPREDVFFELTKQAKLERIAACGCTHFIDDLPELLAEPSFPQGVARLLFDPNQLYPSETRFHRILEWPQAEKELLPAPKKPPAPSPVPAPEPEGELVSAVESLLNRAGFPPRLAPTLEPLPGGANNRVYRVQAGDKPAVLKRYFHAAGDPRDRFQAEFAFYHWAWSRGLRSVPEPLAWDRERRLGLFEFIEGRKPQGAELSPDHVGQALGFLIQLNADRSHPRAGAIPVASEACFSTAEHVARIDGRVERLTRIPSDTAIDQDAATFVREELSPAWQRLRSSVLASAGSASDCPLPSAQRCLSPSDFGFHNALLGTDGTLRFLDFEYAGWDDPAKLIGDFFSQPQIPVGIEHWPTFVHGLDQALGWNGELESRAAVLLPAYRLKWCCIRLNEFLAVDRTRREFAAGGPAAFEERKARQLAATRLALTALING